MINGVLVERTVADVVPALKTNSEGLKKVLDDLLKQYKTKQEEMEKWKVRDFHIHRRSLLSSKGGGWPARGLVDLVLTNC
jgi:Prefoldin subunit